MLLDDSEMSVTPTNAPVSPPIDIPYPDAANPLDRVLHNIKRYNFVSLSDKNLSPISGSLDFESPCDSPLTFAKTSDSECAACDLPLTEINLALFTASELHSCKTSSTNELPLSDIKLYRGRLSRQTTVDSQIDDVSMEVNWETNLQDMDKGEKKTIIHHRSFSDPNILEGSSGKAFLLQKYNESLKRERSPDTLSPIEPVRFPKAFYARGRRDVGSGDFPCAMCVRRLPSNLLAFFSSRRSLSHPANPCVSYSECGQAAVKRHRHSIAGQMSYFKVMGLSYGMPGLKKLIAGSANSLFSTAVISGSSSAPNLRDMIPSTATASGKSTHFYFCQL